jgi:phosphatidylglycerophosphate synthase
MDRQQVLTLPNLLTGSRLVLAPVLVLLAWMGLETVFLATAIFAFLLDAVDGPLARWLHQVTELGPRLDTWADVAIYTVLPVCLWWLWPDLIGREWLYVGFVLTALICPGIAGLIKFRQLTSYHTWLVKVAVLTTALSILVLVLGGPALPFRAASMVCLAAGAEEVMITLVLDKPRSDVRSLLHVLRGLSRGE